MEKIGVSFPGKVGIDARSLRRGPAGIATYVRNLLEHVPFLETLTQPSPANNFLWNQLRVPPAQLRKGWKAFHAPAYTGPLVSFCPLILTAPDISYLIREDWYPYRLDRLRKRYYRASLLKADRIIVTSDFTRQEVGRALPQLAQRVRRTYLGVSEFFRPDADLAAQVRRSLGLPGEYILHVGDIHARRNLPKLVEVAAGLKMPLVLVGKVLRGGEGLAGRPLLFSGLTSDQLKGVYSAATVFVYPSLYEGFGLPLLEAMACEVPVVAANRSCLPEVCGDAALLVEPEVGDLKEGIRTVLDARSEFVKRGLARVQEFTWAATARETVKIYEELF